jgi:hypothetical protein
VIKNKDVDGAGETPALLLFKPSGCTAKQFLPSKSGLKTKH